VSDPEALARRISGFILATAFLSVLVWKGYSNANAVVMHGPIRYDPSVSEIGLVEGYLRPRYNLPDSTLLRLANGKLQRVEGITVAVGRCARIVRGYLGQRLISHRLYGEVECPRWARKATADES